MVRRASRQQDAADAAAAEAERVASVARIEAECIALRPTYQVQRTTDVPKLGMLKSFTNTKLAKKSIEFKIYFSGIIITEQNYHNVDTATTKGVRAEEISRYIRVMGNFSTGGANIAAIRNQFILLEEPNNVLYALIKQSLRMHEQGQPLNFV